MVIHPTDNNTVWVGVIGPLYTNNAHRGIYKTTDGGETWRKTFFINDSTGVIDIVINPKDPNQLYAASWERSRKAWNFKGQGEGSAIYRSDDGGETWVLSHHGFPGGKNVGRIGLKISPSDPQTIYAIVDNHTEIQEKKEIPKKAGQKIDVTEIKKMSKEEFLKIDDKKIEEFLKENDFPKKYTAELIKREVSEEKYSPKVIADYLGHDANADLFNTKIIGAEVYRSSNGGKEWKKVNSYGLDGIYYTYGYYFGELEVSPSDPNQIYIYGVPLLRSDDGGSTWSRLDTLKGINNVHVDHHTLWINPKDSHHLLLGNDGGLYQSYDQGATWLHINNMAVGQFYTVNVDMDNPYNVYGGLQDNGVLKGSSKSIPNESKHWDWVFWGDGMFVAPDPRNSKIVYTGYQFGNYYRLDLEKNKSYKIIPQHNIGEEPLRWNWRSPLFLSKHNPDIVYTAANKVYRSMNRGDSWELLSDDLTRKVKQGNVPYSSIASFTESPLKFGLLYAGTDDGNLWVSHGDQQWTSIKDGLPANKWISSIHASSHDLATVFISLNGYRDDNFRTYIFMSADYGKNWKSISGNLPSSVANVIIQDPVNPDLLFCGLDNGTYASFDRGDTWQLFNKMSNAPAYDMIIHPRDNELVVATHGRSVFAADIRPLQAMKGDSKSNQILVFTPEAVKWNEKWGEKEYEWEKIDLPTIAILFYTNEATEDIQTEIRNEKNDLIRTLKTKSNRGFNKFSWDLKGTTQATDPKNKNAKSTTGTYVEKGKYKIIMRKGKYTAETFVEVK
jgi:photosystem II stability/assembly factor-like uncharacterized protein